MGEGGSISLVLLSVRLLSGLQLSCECGGETPKEGTLLTFHLQSSSLAFGKTLRTKFSNDLIFFTRRFSSTKNFKESLNIIMYQAFVIGNQ